VQALRAPPTKSIHTHVSCRPLSSPLLVYLPILDQGVWTSGRLDAYSVKLPLLCGIATCTMLCTGTSRWVTVPQFAHVGAQSV
jgi:hypothetical protein